MQTQNRTIQVTISGLLIAIGIVIPLFSPVKIILEPASFTLASHVAIFIAMFISPYMAIAVAVGTAIGFFMNFPFVIGMRAASHIIFATGGAFYLKINPETLGSVISLRVFSFIAALIHAVSELIVVFAFFFAGIIDFSNYNKGFLSVFLLVGAGTLVHSMADFEIANIVRAAVKKQGKMSKLFIGRP